MIKFLRLLCMFGFGSVLALSGIGIFSWQFWALLVIILAYGFLQNAEGYQEASGEWPWGDK